MRVLGIDPSLRSTGFGIVDRTAARTRPVAFGVIKPLPGRGLEQRLLEIETELENIIRRFKPAEAAIENPFYAKNIKTAITLGQVRGAVLCALAAAGCRFFEYSALEIKKAVTGYGQADKEQIQIMVRTILNLADEPMPLDASDALAAAICHANRQAYLELVGRSDVS